MFVHLVYTVILSGPQSQTVAPGDTVYFNCHASGSSVEWLINETYAFPRSDYEAKGFEFTDILITQPDTNQLYEANITIVVTASTSINNTRITCRAQHHGRRTDQEATLIVVGLFHSRKLIILSYSMISSIYMITLLIS